ncbi:MAG: conjugal transfer protein TraD [Gammaproteobacteria bacterium]|nr:conjugal transfer protein TraD [Gammaproteobacteria bacterium]MCD8543059.1 conjugal transfer protein TraD [Gammaproteobacteria bacterium]
METQRKIKFEEAKLNRLKLLQSKKHFQERRQATRKKIELGGLVIKAKIDHLPKDILLGAFVHIAEQLELDQNCEIFFKQKGSLAFLETKDNKK